MSEKKDKKFKVIFDREKCVGAGICIDVAPKSFDIGTDQLTDLLDPPGDTLEVLKKAEDECPMQAISVEIDTAE